MQRIFKYPVEVNNRQTVSLPRGAQILSIQNQREEAGLWALVDDTAPHEDRIICCFGTGHLVSVPGGELKFLATVQFGVFVFHFFENVSSEF